MRRIASVLVLCFILFKLNAALPDSSRSGLRIIPLPVLAYTPETDLILGATALGQFTLSDPVVHTRSSNVIAFFNYTLKNQYLLQLDQSIFFPGEKYVWTGEVGFGRFPQNFWGVGHDTPDEAEVLFDQKHILFKQNIYKQIRPHLFTGPRFRFVRLFDVSFETPGGEPVEYAGLTGSGGHTGVALGWGILYDKRNSLLTPSRGSFVELNSLYQHKDMGSTYTFGKMELDARTYFDLKHNHNSVFAFQMKTQHSFGDVPFDLMPIIGGQWIMRGIYQGRYRDKNAVALQAEMRQHIFWRIGAVVFLATGNVGSSISEIFERDWRYTGGGGIRFNIGSDEKTNIRLDYGVGPGTSGLYITFGEAF